MNLAKKLEVGRMIKLLSSKQFEQSYELESNSKELIWDTVFIWKDLGLDMMFKKIEKRKFNEANHIYIDLVSAEKVSRKVKKQLGFKNLKLLLGLTELPVQKYDVIAELDKAPITKRFIQRMDNALVIFNIEEHDAGMYSCHPKF